MGYKKKSVGFYGSSPPSLWTEKMSKFIRIEMASFLGKNCHIIYLFVSIYLFIIYLFIYIYLLSIYLFIIYLFITEKLRTNEQFWCSHKCCIVFIIHAAQGNVRNWHLSQKWFYFSGVLGSLQFWLYISRKDLN